jgi:hypothetical protein
VISAVSSTGMAPSLKRWLVGRKGCCEGMSPVVLPRLSWVVAPVLPSPPQQPCGRYASHCSVSFSPA